MGRILYVSCYYRLLPPRPGPDAMLAIPITDPSAGTTTIGAGADTLLLRVSENAWEGHAQFTLTIDGQPVGGILTARTERGTGSDAFAIRGDWAGGAHQLAVRFINDAYGGSPAADRNLFVEDIVFNGKEIYGGPQGTTYALYGGWSVPGFAFAKPQPVTLGAGPDELVLRLSEDYWREDARARFLVDDRWVGDADILSLHGAGSDTVTIRGDWAAGPHKVSVVFRNDAYGGAPVRDRNLHVDGITLNGATVLDGPATLYANSRLDVGFTEPAPGDPPPGSADIAFGAGRQTLVLEVSENAWQGHAQFKVLVDGRRVGGSFAAQTAHGAGSDSLTLKGNWDPAAFHEVRVVFFNDAYGGSPETDRNLFVDRVTFEGEAVPDAAAALFGAGAARFVVGGDAADRSGDPWGDPWG